MDNILLDGKHTNLKVTDFGLSNTFSRTELMKTHCGSLEYAAPELIVSNDKYGPEVDIWGIGIILYGMVMGKLPFTTHYTDQYRRQKLLIQIEKGLTEIHAKEMSLHGLSQDLSDLLKKLIEPSVKLRLPLSHCEIHPWVTCSGQLLFVPFQSLPRDKMATSQVKEELASMLKITREQIDVTVHESRCHDLSAMYNMMLDSKRFDKGVFEMDFTLKQQVKKEKHTRKPHRKSIKQEQNNTVQNPSTILCPDVEVAPGHTAEHKVQPSHNSTNFDFMALCSAPTWLGGDRRKSRRQKTLSMSQSPNTDTVKAETEEGAAAGSCDLHHLLSPTLASTQVSQLLRRNSSRRKSRKGGSAAGIPNRSSSLRQSYRKRSDTTASRTHIPHSPAIFNTPEIKIIMPTQSPVLTIRHPGDLQEHNDRCDNVNLSSFTRTATVGRHSTYSSRRQRRRRIGSDSSDCGGTVQSDNSNPCSTTNLNGSCTDGFQTVVTHKDHHHEFRASLLAKTNEHTVESRIAATDIRSIVRPKQIRFENKVTKRNTHENVCSLQVPNVNGTVSKYMPSSHEVIIESMQCNNLANLCDAEKLKDRLSGDLQKNDGEKQVEIENSEKILIVSSQQPFIDHNSSKEVIEATSIKRMDNFQSEFDKMVLCNSGNLEIFANNCMKNDEMTDKPKQFRMIRETDHFVADLYSDRERLFLENKALLEDDICYADSCYHTSPQEKLFSRKDSNDEKLLITKRLTNKNLYETESVSAPILLSPQELGITLLTGKSVCDDSRGTIANSVLSSRHGSTASTHFVMPSTPVRQTFHTPIARIESFHSDDFDMYTSDFDVLISSLNPPPLMNATIQTSTVPCFQHTLHSEKYIGRKRSQELTNRESDGNQHDLVGLNSIPQEKNMRDDVCMHDLVTNSESEYEADGQEPAGEKTSNATKARIFPMENSEDQYERKSTKVVVQINDKVKLNSKHPSNENSSKKDQNAVCRTFDWKPATQNEAKRSGWRRAFTLLVKKKTLPTNGSPSGNNNNEDSPSQNHSENTRILPNTRNGYTNGPHPHAVPRNTLDISATRLAIQWSVAKVKQNNGN